MSLGRLGSYEILERIGAGGMGVVFRALDTRPERLDRVVALKVLNEALAGDPESRARLLREARAEASLSDAHIATCYEVGDGPLDPPDLLDPGKPGPHPTRMPFLAMEYVPGEDLETLASRETLPIARVVEFGLQIAAGLEVAHEAGMVHRDLKPANVRITGDGTAKILDFGLARVRASAAAAAEPHSASFHTTESRLLGTPHYMSPEQARGAPLDARSDLFSLGVLLYRLIAGRLPFTGRTVVEVLDALMNEEPQPLARFAAGVPGELQRIVGKLLAKRPADRYQSAHEVATDLRRLRDGTIPGRRARRLPRRALAGGALAAVLAAVGLLAFAHGERPGLFEPASRNVLVLPFANATDDTTLDHVATGFADEVLGDLVRQAGLNVASRDAIGQVPAGERSPRALARALGVGAILSGELRRRDGLLRLDVELINARSGFVRWTGGYDWTFADALRIRRDIVERVAERLSGRPMKDAAASAAPASASAYDAYLKGQRLFDDADDPLAADRASEQFGHALALDPEYAPAWAGRSKALFRIYTRDHGREALMSAEQAADEALRLDPGLLDGRVARAQIYRGTGRTKEAVAELEQVLRVNPDWDEAYLQLAATYRDAGDLAAAERADRRALALRPGYWRNWNALGAILLRRGDLPGARAAFQRIVDLAPRMMRGYEQLAATYLLEGRYADAIAVYRRLPVPVKDAALASNVANAYSGAGRLAEARDYLALAVRLEPQNAVIRENLGDLLVRMGRPAEARAAYGEAARCAEEVLRDDPGRPDLQVQRVLFLAKAGECAEASRTLDALDQRRIADAPEALYALARAHAACGRRAPSLDALRRALARGVAPRRALDDPEFVAMRGDPAFRRTVGATPSTTGPP